MHSRLNECVSVCYHKLEFSLLAGCSVSKKADIYMKVLGGAFIKNLEENADPMLQKMVVRVQMKDGDDMIGFLFDHLTQVDSLMNALHRIRQVMTEKERVHPKLKGPTDGLTH